MSKQNFGDVRKENDFWLSMPATAVLFSYFAGLSNQRPQVLTIPQVPPKRVKTSSRWRTQTPSTKKKNALHCHKTASSRNLDLLLRSGRLAMVGSRPECYRLPKIAVRRPGLGSARQTVPLAERNGPARASPTTVSPTLLVCWTASSKSRPSRGARPALCTFSVSISRWSWKACRPSACTSARLMYKHVQVYKSTQRLVMREKMEHLSDDAAPGGQHSPSPPDVVPNLSARGGRSATGDVSGDDHVTGSSPVHAASSVASLWTSLPSGAVCPEPPRPVGCEYTELLPAAPQ